MPKRASQQPPADTADSLPSTATDRPKDSRYTVVARRYRPKNFDELIGQQTVATALKTAIQTDRVGHAYLFTGARGVGKTSTARIFAKALNTGIDAVTQGTDADTDLAESIDRGEDMDVIEIDGASNRGIEEIRQLRAGAAVRPSRARYKIYIIDEVHMLTLAAFNALLKTLEEPPSHVKFILCTTDPEKVPITVLSRCQRFDFPPIQLDQIQTRLQEICRNEGVVADNDALRLIARRANGSMRDSQSLLEQLLSFAENRIDLATVHSMLGTADDSRLRSLVTALVERRSADVLRELDTAITEGVDAGQVAEQLLGYLRDLMAIQVGGGTDLLRSVDPADVDDIRILIQGWGVTTLLSALQMLDDALVKMRQSVQSRVLLEVCLVQICHLQDLQTVADLAEAIRANAPLPAATRPEIGTSSSPTPNEQIASSDSPQLKTGEKKNGREIDNGARSLVGNEIANPPKGPSLRESQTTRDSPVSDPAILDPQQRLSLWRAATNACEGMVGECAAMAFAVEASSNQSWEIVLPAGSEFAMQILHQPENSAAIQMGLNKVLGRVQPYRLRMAAVGESPAVTETVPLRRQSNNQSQLIRKFSEDPFVEQFLKTLDAEIVKVDVPPDYRID